MGVGRGVACDYVFSRRRWRGSPNLEFVTESIHAFARRLRGRRTPGPRLDRWSNEPEAVGQSPPQRWQPGCTRKARESSKLMIFLARMCRLATVVALVAGTARGDAVSRLAYGTYISNSKSAA